MYIVVLLEEIREKEGGTYGIGAYGMLTPDPSPRDLAFMQILYQAAPDRYEYLNQRVRNILSQMLQQNNYSEIIMKGVAR